MSEDQQFQLAKLIDKEVENKRRVAWGGLGVTLYHSELQLQLIAQSIENKLISPVTTENIAEAEQALAIVKGQLKNLVQSRIAQTKNLDPVIERLMKPEKDLTASVEKNVTEIIQAKKQAEAEKKTKENKDKELKQVAEQVRVYIADMHASYLNAQAKLIADSYKHALENNITKEALPAYVTKVKGRVTLANRETPAPKIMAVFNDQKTIDDEVVKLFTPWTPKQYVNGFNIDIDKKYEDWELALKNKEIAADLNTKEFTETVEAVNEQKEQETLIAKLDTIAAPVEDVTTKELKREYKIPEPQSMEEAYIIMNAFIVNKKLCTVPKIKPINFSIKQMMAALEGIKKDDLNFSFTGLIFTQIEKL